MATWASIARTAKLLYFRRRHGQASAVFEDLEKATPAKRARRLSVTGGPPLTGVRHILSKRPRAIRCQVAAAGGHERPIFSTPDAPLDLDITAFPVDMSARTLLRKAEIVLCRTAPSPFRLDVWRSFMPYVASLLLEAARDLT